MTDTTNSVYDLLPEAEREILLNMWPRYEDGGLVDITDVLAQGMVVGIELCTEGFKIECLHGSISSLYGDRVERFVTIGDETAIHKGDTVYWLDHTMPFTVVSAYETHDNVGHELKCGNTVEIKSKDGDVHLYVHPANLSSTKPDSWNLIERDVESIECERFTSKPSFCGTEECPGYHDCSRMLARDLVRRCKNLAGRI